MVAMLESEEMETPWASWRKTAAFALSRCTSWARLPLLECSLWLLFTAQLSGKADKNSDRTIVVAVVHWCLPLWQNCEWGNNSFSSLWHPHCGSLLQLVEVQASRASWHSTIKTPGWYWYYIKLACHFILIICKKTLLL